MALINTVTDKKQLYSLSQNSEGLTDHVGEDMVVVGVAQWETTRKATGDESVCTGFVLDDGRYSFFAFKTVSKSASVTYFI